MLVVLHCTLSIIARTHAHTSHTRAHTFTFTQSCTLEDQWRTQHAPAQRRRAPASIAHAIASPAPAAPWALASAATPATVRP